MAATSMTKRQRFAYRCADCGVDTFAINEWYMVKDELWQYAWSGRRRSGVPAFTSKADEILCIGCLEDRIDRKLVADDFTDVPINDPTDTDISARMRDRLTREWRW